MIRFLAVLGFLNLISASANDRVLDFSSACKVYELEGKNWNSIDPTPFYGLEFSEDQVLKDDVFTVFKTDTGTYGVDQKCLRRSKWAAAFSLGMNLSTKGTIASSVGGTTTTADVSFKSALAFTGAVSYRVNKKVRLAAEIGLSRLAESSATGNETSYFDFTPELIFQTRHNIEFHMGPNIGLFFFSQNAQSDAVHSFAQQSASSLLLGLNAGADYSITNQFDLGLVFQYLKPGALNLTGTRLADSATTEAVLRVDYLMLGTRFTIHF